jgi:hypothetical protein
MARIDVALVVSIALGAWTFGQGPRQPVAVFTDTPPTWFDDFDKVADVSPDGRWAIYGAPGNRRFVDLQTGREAGRFMRGFERVQDGIFLPDGTVARRGTRGGRGGWFLGEGTTIREIRIPADASTPRWSRKGRVAFMRAAARTMISVGEEDARTDHEFGKRIVGFAWMPDGETILVLTRETWRSTTVATLWLVSVTVEAALTVTSAVLPATRSRSVMPRCSPTFSSNPSRAAVAKPSRVARTV